MYRALAIALVLALLFAATPAVARAALGDDEWDDPFCAASVSVIPWNDGADAPDVASITNRYAVQLWADGRQSVAGRVVFVADDGAYAVTMPVSDLLRKGGTHRFYTAFVPVVFDTRVQVRYAYVDSVAIDGEKAVDCPTVVTLVNRSRAGDQPSWGLRGVTSLHAAFVQALPALNCGKWYIAPEMLGEGPLVGHFGDDRRTTVVRVYIDSNGIPVKERVEQSSGVDGLDDAAVGAVQQSHYRPAQFLCTPVVSEMLVDMEYVP